MAPEYNFLPDDPQAVYSAASHSEEWLEYHTVDKLDREAAVRTAMVTANTFSRSDRVNMNVFAYLDEVWTHRWDNKLGTTPASAVTNAAVDLSRDSPEDANRLIA